MKNIYELLAEEYKLYKHKHVLPDMTKAEWKLEFFKTHPKRLLAGVPTNIDDDNDSQLKEIFQKIYDTEFDWYKSKYPGYNKAIYIENQIHLLTEFPLTLHSPTDQIKVTRYLRFIENKKNSSILIRDTLEKALDNDEKKIKFIKDWFIQNKFCDPDTFNYKDRRKGNKGWLVCILKNLQVKGYLEKQLHPDEIRLIAQNSFRFGMRISIINKTSDETYDIKLPPYHIT